MNFKDNNPIYLQIAERICDEILQGRYSEDDRIPSVREYAAMVEVNANTVVRTFDYLQSLEVIYNKRGLGYFVAKGAVRHITKERKLTNVRSATSEVLERLIPPRRLSLEQSLEFCRDDECVEVTPEAVRIRKVVLDQTERARATARARR